MAPVNANRASPLHRSDETPPAAAPVGPRSAGHHRTGTRSCTAQSPGGLEDQLAAPLAAGQRGEGRRRVV